MQSTVAWPENSLLSLRDPLIYLHHGHSIFLKNRIFYVTVFPVLKCFCSGILVSYPETAKRPYWMLGKNPTFWQTKELYLHWNPKPPVSSPWVQDYAQVFLSAELQEQWKVRLGSALDIRADLPSAKWSRQGGLVTLPPSHSSITWLCGWLLKDRVLSALRVDCR